MILAEETTKYLADNEGVLNVQLMMKLLQVVAYNLAKSRAARDGNKLKRKNFRPRHIHINYPVLVRNHTAKPFEARSNDYICVGFQGNNRVFVKDNHGTITKVNRKDVSPVEMDIKIAELFKESREKSKIRDAQLAMPTSKIPDLGWQFDEDVQLIGPVTEEIYSLDQFNEKEETTPLTPTASLPEEDSVEETKAETILVEEVKPKEVQTVQPTAPLPEEDPIEEIKPVEEVEPKEVQTVQPICNLEKPDIVADHQTPIVFKFLAVLQPVAAAVSKQIMNKTHF